MRLTGVKRRFVGPGWARPSVGVVYEQNSLFGLSSCERDLKFWTISSLVGWARLKAHFYPFVPLHIKQKLSSGHRPLTTSTVLLFVFIYLLFLLFLCPKSTFGPTMKLFLCLFLFLSYNFFTWYYLVRNFKFLITTSPTRQFWRLICTTKKFKVKNKFYKNYKKLSCLFDISLTGIHILIRYWLMLWDTPKSSHSKIKILNLWFIYWLLEITFLVMSLSYQVCCAVNAHFA